MKAFEYFYFSAGENNKGDFVLTYHDEELSYHRFFQPVMSKLGSEGWELINVIPVTATEAKSAALIPFFAKADTFVSLTYTSGQVFYFKREINNMDLDLKNSAYSAEYKYLEQIDHSAHNEVIVKKQEQEMFIEGDANSIIERYDTLGYLVKFQHDDRLIFGKGAKEIRYDRDPKSGGWKIKAD